jgi:hypothetical protein
MSVRCVCARIRGATSAVQQLGLVDQEPHQPVGGGKSSTARLTAYNIGAHSRQRRSLETDYVLLHEIARHGVHVNETLGVAVRSLCAVQQHHEKFSTERRLVSGSSTRRSWDAVGDHFKFQVRFLEGLVERSQANNARIQNEITLVSP